MATLFRTSYVNSRGVGWILRSSPLLFLLVFAGCSLFATRPVQEMSDTAAAIRAAREVQADVLAPENYRQASEWFFKAKKEYKFKNFLLAKDYAKTARHFAEQAEFDSIRGGGNRADDQQAIPDPFANATDPQKAAAPPPGNAAVDAANAPPPAATPQDTPTPTGTPADVYDQRKAEEDAAARLQQQQQQQPQPQPQASPQIVPLPGIKAGK